MYIKYTIRELWIKKRGGGYLWVGICALYLATSVHSKVICIIPYWERLGEGHSGVAFNSQTVECYS